MRAHAIMAAWQDAQARGAGVTVVDGMLVEALHVEDAQRVLALAQAIAAD
ncbi:citrate lyase subunit beta [Bordetella pertussis]|nr:citrate lyase subunit beta [Bordetella pertussis]